MTNSFSKKIISLYTLFALVFILPISIRDSNFISDGDNYLIHPLMNIDFSQAYFYSSPIYWTLVSFFSKIPSEYFIFFISFLISFFIVISSTQLALRYRLVFLFFYITNPIIFNISQVALRNGLAISLIILSLSFNRVLLMLLAPLVHPGTLPIVVILTLLKYKEKSNKVLFFFILSILILFSPKILSFISVIIETRGYGDSSEGAPAGIFTYIAFLVLSMFYWFSTSKSPYRIFMPLAVGLWIIAGTQFAFAGRIFLQSAVLFLFIVLQQPTRSRYRVYFLWLFGLVTIYTAYNSHPLIEYSEGWLNYWLSFI